MLLYEALWPFEASGLDLLQNKTNFDKMDKQLNPHLITDRSSRHVPFRTNADPRLARYLASYRKLCAEDYDSEVTALCEAVALEILHSPKKSGSSLLSSST